jgi:3-hydroxyisobutyrate dehydrogenase-like beta-hydroxyacid dehydrogenase
MAIETIGLIGVGLMGHGIGKNILTKGFKLNVLAHKNRVPVESLIAKGAHECNSVAEIASSCDLVILVVTGTPQVEAIATELFQHGRKGLIIADCSTSEPSSTKRLAAEAANHEMRFIDTPMTRTPNEAEAGKLGLMVGGDANLLETIRPVLSCFADLIVHTGAVGSGHQVKLINNFLSIGHATIAAEAITVAAKAGVDMAST